MKYNISLWQARTPRFVVPSTSPFDLNADYKRVGVYSEEAENIMYALEAIFEKTQNLDETHRNPNFRSTSVGDLMLVTDGNDGTFLYAVDSFGFKQMFPKEL